MQAYRKAVVVCAQMTSVVYCPSPIGKLLFRPANSILPGSGSLIGPQGEGYSHIRKKEYYATQPLVASLSQKPQTVKRLAQRSFLQGERLQLIIPAQKNKLQTDLRQFSTKRGPAGIVMASVKQSSFKELYEKDIVKAIEDADFIAFDFEFTGVESAPFRRPVELDTSETRYLKLRHSASNFALVQLGLCAMRWDATKDCFIANPYNFHVYPRATIPGIRDMPSRSFVSQVASLDFLASHNIDFNAWIRTGISYISEEQEVWARAHLGLDSDSDHSQVLKDDQAEVALTTTGSILFHERFVRTLGEWRDGVLRDLQAHQAPPAGTLAGHPSGAPENPEGASSQLLAALKEAMVPAATVQPTEDEAEEQVTDGGLPLVDLATLATGVVATRPNLLLPKMVPREDRIARQAARKRFADIVLVPEGEGNKKRLRAVYCSKEERSQFVKALHGEKQQALEARVVEARGLRVVIDALAKSGKPLVGHNCFLDLVHIHEKFFGALPPSADQFVAKTRERFPCILDTKYLVRAEPELRSKLSGQSSQLAALYETALALKVPPGTGEGLKVEFAEELSRYQESSYKHEAGYDAYMTAVVFARSCQVLGVDPQDLQGLTSAVAALALTPPSGQQTGQAAAVPAGNQRGEGQGPGAGDGGGAEQGEALDQSGREDGSRVLRLALRANALTMGRKGPKEMAFDLLTARETQGARNLPGPKGKTVRRDDRQNVLFVWNIPRDVNVDQLRKEAQILLGPWRTPLPYVVFLDEGAALLEFVEQRMVEQMIDVLDPSRQARDGKAAATRLVQGGTRGARFGAFHRLCSSTAVFSSASEGAEALGLGHSDEARPKRAAGSSPNLAIEGQGWNRAGEARSGAAIAGLDSGPRSKAGQRVASDGDDSRKQEDGVSSLPGGTAGEQARDRSTGLAGWMPRSKPAGSSSDRGANKGRQVKRRGEAHVLDRRGHDWEVRQLQKALEAELASDEEAEAEKAGEAPSGEGLSSGGLGSGQKEVKSGDNSDIEVEKLRERVRQRLGRPVVIGAANEESTPGEQVEKDKTQLGASSVGPGRPMRKAMGFLGADRDEEEGWQQNRHIRFGDNGESILGGEGQVEGGVDEHQVVAEGAPRKRLRPDH